MRSQKQQIKPCSGNLLKAAACSVRAGRCLYGILYLEEKEKRWREGEKFFAGPAQPFSEAFSLICGLVSVTLCLPSCKPYILLSNPPMALDPLKTPVFPG